MTSTRTALVLGATGGIGGEAAANLLRRGWTVRGLHRDPAEAARRTPWLDGIDWIAGDAMRPADVIEAARGVGVIVHGVNPPGYVRWGELVLPMLDATIAAARASGARIVLPGTIYNYGPDAFPLLLEDAPQHPNTEKGEIRAEMERRLRVASDTGARTIIVRAGDYFGPRAGNSMFARALVRPGRPVRSVTHPGRPGVGHAWAYLPDVAEAMARLVEREAELGAFENFHLAGHWDADGTQMTAAIRRAAGNPALKLRRFPWALVAAASPVVPLFRALWQMRYVWREPIRLDNRRLVAALGREPHTPLDAAVRTTLAGLGCLATQQRPAIDATARGTVANA